MRVLKRDPKENLTVVLVDTPEDLWYLSKILKKGDRASGTTFRTIVLDSGEKERKKIWVELLLDSVKFQKYSNEITLTGSILAGSPEEYIQKGRQQNINVKVGDSLGIKKEWSIYEKDLLERAIASSKRKVAYVVLLDDRSAYCCWLREIGVEEDAPVHLEGSKRAGDYEKKQKEFFDELYRRISDKEVVIIGGFGSSSFISYIEERKKPPLIQVKVSSADITGVRELISSNPSILKEASAMREEALLQEFLAELRKEKGRVVYGPEAVGKAVEQKNVRLLLVHHSLLEDNSIRALLEKAEKEAGAEVSVFSDSPAGEQLKHFGIAAFLYY